MHLIMELKDLKHNYNALAKKYALPSFKELNEDFEIEKIDKNTDALLKIIRKIMMEKIINSLSFAEFLLNPMNAPRIYAGYVRSISPDDRKHIEKIYSTLGALSILSLDLEIDYSEKKEAEMIKKIYNTWTSLKPDFRKIFEDMKRPNGVVVKKERAYFG